MLALAVEVGGDGAGADVHRLADGGVAEIAEMMLLRPPAHPGALELGVVADAAARTNLAAGTQVAVRTDLDVLGNGRGLNNAGPYARTGPDAAVDDMAVGPDDRVRGDDRGPEEHRPRLDARVLPDLHPGIDARRGRVDDRDAGPHVRLGNAAAHQLLRLGERDAVVDPHREPRVGRGHDRDRAALLDGEGEEIGEVQLAGAARAHGWERVPQPGRVEAIRAGVDLVDGAHGVVGVSLFTDLADRAIGPANDATVAGRVGDACGEQRQRRASGRVLLDHARQQLGRQQRGVAHRHEQRARPRWDAGQTDANGIGSAALRRLTHRREPSASLDDCLDLGGTVAHDHDRRRETRLCDRVEDVREHGPAREGVNDLGTSGTHSGSLAGGQDDGRGRSQR